MEKRKWADLLRYASPRSILVVTWENKIMELYCPFKVRVVANVDGLTNDSILIVDMVKVSKEVIMVYIIDNQPYYYYHFSILIE